jgi:alcohol dehydrogenase class IV
MLLPEVTAWSVPGAEERYAHSARTMGIATDSDSNGVALGKLVDGLRQLSTDLSVPGPGAYGIDESTWFDSLDLMAEQALASGSPNNNPRIPQAPEIVELYRRVWAAQA